MRKLLAIASLIAPGICGGCGGSTVATMAEPQPVADRYVGNTYWTDAKHPIGLCASLPSMRPRPPGGCTPLAAGTRVEVQEAIYSQSRYVSIVDGYRVSLADGKTGYIFSTEPIFLLSADDKKQKDAEKALCNRRGGVSIGMTAAQVLASCWGKPRDVNETLTPRGKHEQWVYGRDYVYLDNGIVISIQTSR